MPWFVKQKNFEVEMNDIAEKLFSGDFINGKTLGYIAGEILKETIGGGSTSHQHFNKGQGNWPALAPSTLRDKRKKDKRKFVYSGTVKNAILNPPINGKLREWGSSADYGVAKQFKKQRYTANGIYSVAVCKANSLTIITGFSGKLKHSSAFKRARKDLAVSRGADLKGLRGKARTKTIIQAASVSDTEKFLAETGRGKLARNKKKRVVKFAAKGALGTKGRGFDLARGKQNLAYANVVQTGKFAGIKTKSGKLFNAKQIGDMIRSGKKGKLPSKSEGYSRVFSGKSRELLPYQNSDAEVVKEAVAYSLQQIFRKMGG